MKKNTIIFVHGAWHGKWCWDQYYKKYFSDKGYQVITFDLPGHEKPGYIKGINKFSLQDYVRALKEEVQKVAHLPILIGHSMGGLIVQKYLEAATCKAAILMTPAPPSGLLRAALRFSRRPYFVPSLLTANLYKLVNSPEKAATAFFRADMDKEELAAYTSQLCSESFRAFLEMFVPMVKVNHHLTIPMLVVAAEKDQIFSIAENKSTAAKYNADLLVIKEATHDLMLDAKQQEAADAILHWLDKKINS